MPQTMPVADGAHPLSSWAAAFSQLQETGHETIIPLQQIFDVAAYPFGETSPGATSESLTSKTP